MGYYIESAFEHVCKTLIDKWEVTQIDGKMRFDVPGYFAAAPGSTHMLKQTSDLWTIRLRGACWKALGDIGDEELYSKYQSYFSVPKTGQTLDAASTVVGAES